MPKRSPKTGVPPTKKQHQPADIADHAGAPYLFPDAFPVTNTVDTEPQGSIVNDDSEWQDELLATDADEFKLLCQIALDIQKIAPWESMDETDVFGFEDPNTGELGFVSVMGLLGEYTAIAVYLGAEGLYQWRAFEENLRLNPNSEEARDMFFEMPHLQMVIGPSEFLEKRDREILKRSGLKFGKQKPSFRSHRPGYLPWFITWTEASLLIHALVHTITITKKFGRVKHQFFENKSAENRDYLVCSAKTKDQKVEWEYSVRQIDPPPTQLIPLETDKAVVDQLRQTPKAGVHEVALFTLPARLGNAHERPMVLYALLLSDSASYFILGFDALSGVNGIDLMYAGVAEYVAGHWLEHGVVPEELHTLSTRLLNVLRPLTDRLGVRLSLVKKLPAIADAKRSIEAEMFGG